MTDRPLKVGHRLVETEIDDEVIVMRLSDGDFFSLGGTSREVWQCIDGERSVADIADELAARHGAALEPVRADVARFITELRDAGFIELV